MISSTGSYFYPTGDASLNYSPITINFTGGTFAAGAYFTLNLSNTKQPQNANTNNYLKRYWSVGLIGMTFPVYSVSAQYVDSDVVGRADSLSN